MVHDKLNTIIIALQEFKIVSQQITRFLAQLGVPIFQ
jgi:hypothetical protein